MCSFYFAFLFLHFIVETISIQINNKVGDKIFSIHCNAAVKFAQTANLLSTPIGNNLIVSGWEEGGKSGEQYLFGSIYNNSNSQFVLEKFRVSTENIDDHPHRIVGVMVTKNKQYIIFVYYRWFNTLWPMFFQTVYAGTNHNMYRLGTQISNETYIPSKVSGWDSPIRESLILNNERYVVLWENRTSFHTANDGKNLYLVFYDILSSAIVDIKRFGDTMNANDTYNGGPHMCYHYSNVDNIDISESFYVVSNCYISGIRNVRIRKYRNNIPLSPLITIYGLSGHAVCTHLPDTNMVIVCAEYSPVNCIVLNDSTLQTINNFTYLMYMGNLQADTHLITVSLMSSMYAVICDYNSYCYVLNQNMTIVGYLGDWDGQRMVEIRHYPYPSRIVHLHSINSNVPQYYLTYVNRSISPYLGYAMVCEIKLTTNSPSDMPTLNPTLDPTLNPTLKPTFNPTLSPTFYPTLNPTYPTYLPTLFPSTSPTFPTSHPSSDPTTKFQNISLIIANNTKCFYNKLNINDLCIGFSLHHFSFCCSYLYGSTIETGYDAQRNHTYQFKTTIFNSNLEMYRLINKVRRLNLSSLILDTVFLCIAVMVYCFIQHKHKSTRMNEAKKYATFVTIFGTVIDILLSSVSYNVVFVNNLGNTADNLWKHGCFSWSVSDNVSGIRGDLQSILFLDVLEISVDVISVLIWCLGQCNIFCFKPDYSEIIHLILFGILDMILVYANYFSYVKPTYDAFIEMHNNEEKLCYIIG
eukprot:513849_1